MKYTLIALLMLLTGCITAPVKHSFPKPPDGIVERCSDLSLIVEGEERLSELLKVVTKNYSTYYDCAARHDLLVKWLNDQRALHDEVVNKGN